MTAPVGRICRKREGLVDAVGNTPLIRINSISDATGCEILGRAEFLIPGGSVKDRVAVKIIEEALDSGDLVQGGVVTEGSAGSTAISLATIAPAYGCKCHVVIPVDVATEKSQILEALGATVERVRPVSITHKDHYVNIARRALEATNRAATAREAGKIEGKDLLQMNGHASKQTESHPCSTDCKGSFFADQFENLANFRVPMSGLALRYGNKLKGNCMPLLLLQVQEAPLLEYHGFSRKKNPKIKCFLIDPPGSGLFNKVTRGVMYTKEEAEGQLLKNPFDTITEGIGINRLTKNFMMAELDGAYQGMDREAVEMSRFLLKNGLFVGSSSAMNCVGAVQLARSLGPGHTGVTIFVR